MSNLSERWTERIAESEGIKNQEVKYNLGYPKITEDEIWLHHDDVIRLLVLLLEERKFRNILGSRYPAIFIDEYQDTNKELVESLVRNYIVPIEGPLLGFFGDHWQRIYGANSVGSIDAPADKLLRIGKEANFRSDRLIVQVLNRMRPELIQHVKDPESTGVVSVYHTNTWPSERSKGSHWAGDMSPDAAHDTLQQVIQKLNDKGWDFAAEKTKILMLTNSILAAEQGYQNLHEAMSADDLLKKNDVYISFLADTVEPGAMAFSEKKYGEMLTAFNVGIPLLKTQADKMVWSTDVGSLVQLRKTGTIGNVIDLLKNTKKPALPRRIVEKEKKLADLLEVPEADRDEEDKLFISKLQKIRNAPYTELMNVVEYIDDKTLFSTKHGVKGAEFENVLIVLGRGWNLYNWNLFLEWVHSGVPADKKDTYERNRNLFYVACSRPQKRLALLFTQLISETGMKTLENWFAGAIESINFGQPDE